MKTYRGDGVSHRREVCPLCRAQVFVEIGTGVACEVIDLEEGGRASVPGSAHVHVEIAEAERRWTRGFDYNGYSDNC